jgi:hypothetical protein
MCHSIWKLYGPTEKHRFLRIFPLFPYRVTHQAEIFFGIHTKASDVELCSNKICYAKKYYNEGGVFVVFR